MRVIPENTETISSPAAASASAGAEEARPGLPPEVTRWVGIGLIFAIVALSVWLLLNPVWIARFGSWGYLGAFLVNLMASASIILPIPGLPIAIAMGVSMNSLLLAIAAAAGSAIGELAGYWLGYGGRALTANSPADAKISQWAPRIEAWTRHYGAIAIFAVAALPLPFDFAGIAAGAGKMPIWRFLLATLAGKFVKYYVVILVAEGSLSGVRNFFGW